MCSRASRTQEQGSDSSMVATSYTSLTRDISRGPLTPLFVDYTREETYVKFIVRENIGWKEGECGGMGGGGGGGGQKGRIKNYNNRKQREGENKKIMTTENKQTKQNKNRQQQQQIQQPKAN